MIIFRKTIDILIMDIYGSLLTMDIIDADATGISICSHVSLPRFPDIQLCLGSLHPGVLQRLTVGKFSGLFFSGFQYEKMVDQSRLNGTW